MTSSPTDGPAILDDVAGIEEEILELESRLAKAKSRLQSNLPTPTSNDTPATLLPPPTTQSTHFLLLLSDSALPLGSFAFSSGLESYLAHANRSSTARGAARPASIATTFLPASVSSLAAAQLPFVLAAHRDPSALPYLDDALDAAVVCTVGRRASVAQGRALLGVWERSFAGAGVGASGVLEGFGRLLKGGGGGAEAGSADDLPPVSAHLAPLFGVIAQLVGLSLQQTVYVFMLSHVKALVSAAVRAGTFGPYQAQKVLGSGETQSLINAVIEREWDTPVE